MVTAVAKKRPKDAGVEKIDGRKTRARGLSVDELEEHATALAALCCELTSLVDRMKNIGMTEVSFDGRLMLTNARINLQSVIAKIGGKVSVQEIMSTPLRRERN